TIDRPLRFLPLRQFISEGSQTCRYLKQETTPYVHETSRRRSDQARVDDFEAWTRTIPQASVGIPTRKRMLDQKANPFTGVSSGDDYLERASRRMNTQRKKLADAEGPPHANESEKNVR